MIWKSKHFPLFFIGRNGRQLRGGGYANDIYVNDFWEVDVWNHICLTYHNNNATLYANGTQVATESKNWNTTENVARIGQQTNELNEFWKGSIDDVRIYNRALSEQEIKRLYESYYNYVELKGYELIR
ncbi:MAG: LamG domain-containing protein [Candidatus Woesearchaeota archaeon]